MRLALYTFGVFIKPSDDPANVGFHALDRQIWPILDRAEGLIARSGYEGDPGPASWGEHAYPRFYTETGDGHSPSTLSLWQGIEAAMAFSYSGLHAEALKSGRSWFRTPHWPPYVAWWHERSDYPTWAEAADRHEYLHDHGSSSHAFSFKQAFDPNGHACTPDPVAIRAIVGRASSRTL